MTLCESIIQPFLNLGRNGLTEALSYSSSCWFRITIHLTKVIKKKPKLHWQWFLQSLSSCILCWYLWRIGDDIYYISRKLFAFLFFLIRFLECVRNAPVQRCLVVCGVKVTSWTIILLYIFRFALAASSYLLCTFPYHKKLRGLFESLGYVVFFPLMNYMYRCVVHVMTRMITHSSAYICVSKYSPPFTSTLCLFFWFFKQCKWFP